MDKFLKILKYVFSLGILLYTDYQKEKSKTKVLIHNVNQMLEVGRSVTAMVKDKQSVDAIQAVLKPENLKNLLSTYQVSKGLYAEISADVNANK